MVHCKVCMRIDFDSLPSEEENAIPHHSSLKDLEKSAEKCKICKLILWAGCCSLAPHGGGSTVAPGIVLPSGNKPMALIIGGNYTTFGLHWTEKGASLSNDFSKPRPNFEEPNLRSPHEFQRRFKRIRPYLFGNWWAGGLERRVPQLIGLGVRFGTSPAIEDGLLNHKDEVVLCGSYLRLRTDDACPMAATIPGRLRVDDQYSPIAMKRIQAWLKKCDMIHHCAGPLGSGVILKELPTRVLDVTGPGNSIKLVNTGGTLGRYIALSHSWGKSHRLMTTKNNLSDHVEGIRLVDLPATFKSAVEFTRALQISYLWIDSLCIVQDDKWDWEIEASKMGLVYANSYLTLSALCSSDDSSGLCSCEDIRFGRPQVSSETISTGKRCIPNAAPTVVGPNPEYENTFIYRQFHEFGVRQMTHFGRKSNIYITREWMPSSLKKLNGKVRPHLIGAFGGTFDPCADEPLSKRGWVLQERLLAPRTLHFGTDEMYWECQDYVLAEDGAVFIGRTQDPERNSWPRPWFRVVEEYNRRALTQNSDKLPALSGLAHMIQESTGDEYLAGLWRRNLVQCLYWNVETHEPSHHCHDPQHIAELPSPSKAEFKVPSTYRAPSWSWAANDTRIEYAGALSEERLVAEVLEAHVEPLGKDAFGQVASGWIKIKAPLHLVSFSPERQHRNFETPIKVRGSNGNTVNGSARYDLGPVKPTFALFLDPEHALLVGVSTGVVHDNIPAFKRVGTAFFYPDTQKSPKTVEVKDKNTGGKTIKGDDNKDLEYGTDDLLAKLTREKMDVGTIDAGCETSYLVKADGNPQVVVIY